MRCFAGIDIGSTNIKILMISEDGAIVYTASSSTPYTDSSGFHFFDIRKLDAIVDDFIKKANSMGNLVSVSFSSIGESIVPLDNHGEVVFDAVFWNENRARPSEKQLEIISENTDYSIDGISVNGLMMSLEKILWYERFLGDKGIKVSSYLPLASYEVFRKTGYSSWDYSLASRSHAYDVFRMDWNYRLLDKLGLSSLGALGYAGSYAGEKGGVVYGLGGHDHDMGLFGLRSIIGSDEFIFDSMGTSSTISLITTDKDAVIGTKTQCRNNGGVINGFADNQYIVFRACSQYGSILAFLMRRYGLEPDDEGYRNINSLIAKNADGMLAFLMRCGGNFLSSDILPRNEIDFHKVHIELPAEYFIKSAYIYLGMKARQITENLESFNSGKHIPYYVGGAASRNDLFMRYKASFMKRKLTYVPVKEICALGAACSGIMASGNTDVFINLSHMMYGAGYTIPDDRLSRDLSAAEELYSKYEF